MSADIAQIGHVSLLGYDRLILVSADQKVKGSHHRQNNHKITAPTAILSPSSSNQMLIKSEKVSRRLNFAPFVTTTTQRENTPDPPKAPQEENSNFPLVFTRVAFTDCRFTEVLEASGGQFLADTKRSAPPKSHPEAQQQKGHPPGGNVLAESEATFRQKMIPLWAQTRLTDSRGPNHSIL